MNATYRRIAAGLVLGLVLLAGWWWMSGTQVSVAVRPDAAGAARAGTQAPGAQPSRPHTADDASATALGEQCGEALLASLRQRQRELEARGSASALLAVAAMQRFVADEAEEQQAIAEPDAWMAAQRSRRIALFERVRTLAPGHPDIAWLLADACGSDAECVPFQKALQRAEPDNLAVWLQAMDRARMQQDDAAFERAFARAAAATHHDTHRGTQLLAVLEGYGDLDTPSSCRHPAVQARFRREMPGMRELDMDAFLRLSAMAAEIAQVAHTFGLRRACDRDVETHMPAARHAQCIAAYRTLAKSDSLVEQQIATSQLVRLTADHADGGIWREQYRSLQWLRAHVADPAVAAALRTEDLVLDEVDAWTAALRAAGKWPPPANWLPDDPNQRSLILTGHPSPKP